MMNVQVNKDAPNIFGLIPPNSVGAEIGVWMGNTSEGILSRVQGIKKIHLVDSWSVVPYKNNSEMSFQEYIARYQEITNEISEQGFMNYYEQVYKHVLEKFKFEPRIEIHRMLSSDWFNMMEKENLKLDWIYIDGDHSYEGCLSDLRNGLSILKNGGTLFGDDYKWPGTKWGKPGVTKAVNKFREENPLLMQFFRHGETQFSIKKAIEV